MAAQFGTPPALAHNPFWTWPRVGTTGAANWSVVVTAFILSVSAVQRQDRSRNDCLTFVAAELIRIIILAANDMTSSQRTVTETPHARCAPSLLYPWTAKEHISNPVHSIINPRR
jgi:hypothetical protein